MIRPKDDKAFDKMYDEINGKDLIYCKIDRELVNDIVLKMTEICDYYWDNVSCKHFIKSTDEGINRNREMFERNILCYRILNNKTTPEAATRNTVLSIIASVYAFMLQIGNNENIFTDSNFCNTIGLCSIFEWTNKKVTDKKMIEYYKCCNIDDGQPFTSKHWFFNKPDLMDRINDFLNFDVNEYMVA